jgi:beta-glucosidase
MAEAKFPKRFLWGAAVAAHQVEGGNHNQWAVWEHENAHSLAAQARYHYGDLASWDVVKQQANDPKNYISGEASGHFDKYVEDIALAKSMNLNALRFSVEWSRIEPTEGSWDSAGIDYYKRYVKELVNNDIEPILTLFHFTLPVWFAELGGFEKRANIKYFVRFAQKIIDELGAGISYVITINEPEVYAYESYYLGHWPPALQSKRMAFKVLGNLVASHNQVAALIHAKNRRYKVSIAKNSNYFYAGDDSALSIRSATMMQYFQDDIFLKRVVKSCDFIGMNFYFSNRVYGYRVHNPNEMVSDLGWDMSPADLEHGLERVYAKYKLPIIITENGCADASDKKRQWWLTHTMLAMQRAIKSGVDVRGYMHWSLIDNFEWDKGKWPRFGLIEVDYSTMQRTVRPSGRRYGTFIKGIRSKHG